MELLSIAAGAREDWASPPAPSATTKSSGCCRACAGARAGGASTGADELERLRFIQRLKTLGLTLAEVKQLNAALRDRRLDARDAR